MMEIIVGPCSIESYEQLETILKFMKKHDLKNLRGGVLKYRSDKNLYQGNIEAYDWVRELKQAYDFKFYNEVFCGSMAMQYLDVIDVIQIGSRNMYNTHLLKNINKLKKSVLFKRHFCASLREFAEHSKYLDNCDVKLCLRGRQSMFIQEQRFVPDFSDISRLANYTDNDIYYDASHAACFSEYVTQDCLAALEYAPDGLILEIHPAPLLAFSDSQQQLDLKSFDILLAKINQKINQKLGVKNESIK